MSLKKKIFATLDQVCKPGVPATSDAFESLFLRCGAGTVLASNTSYLNIDEIAGATKRPQDAHSRLSRLQAHSVCTVCMLTIVYIYIYICMYM